MQIVGVIAVLAVMLGLWIVGSRFGTEGRGNQARFSDTDSDGAPDLSDAEKQRARQAFEADETGHHPDRPA